MRTPFSPVLASAVLLALAFASGCNSDKNATSSATNAPANANSSATSKVTDTPTPVDSAKPADSPKTSPTPGSADTPKPTSAPPSATAVPPTTTLPAASLSLSVSSPVKRGSNASASVQGATPGVSCTISYTTPSGTDSTAAGLTTKTAGSNGSASWSWVIGSNTNPGTGSVRVNCGGQQKTASITITS
jgi:hypothetical protein